MVFREVLGDALGMILGLEPGPTLCRAITLTPHSLYPYDNLHLPFGEILGFSVSISLLNNIGVRGIAQLGGCCLARGQPRFYLVRYLASHRSELPGVNPERCWMYPQNEKERKEKSDHPSFNSDLPFPCCLPAPILCNPDTEVFRGFWALDRYPLTTSLPGLLPGSIGQFNSSLVTQWDRSEVLWPFLATFMGTKFL